MPNLPKKSWLDALLKISGTVALYGCTSTFLAAILLGAYLSYAWNIDKNKRLRLWAIAQGHDIADLQRQIEDKIARMSYDDVLELRAKRLREAEFQNNSSENAVKEIVAADEKDIDAKLKQFRRQRAAFDKYVNDYVAGMKTKGLSEETRLIEEAEPEMAKDIILGIIKEYNDYNRVLTMLLAMDEQKRGAILYAMSGEEEQKKLVDLLQRIGNGEPLAKVAEDAADKAKQLPLETENNTGNTNPAK
ncbi:hypothetical protein FACS189427_03750 [Planctomycetales bacterium]|nr:hypothetical protein FACS189427_03750 [Planctomycetales bacterium]